MSMFSIVFQDPQRQERMGVLLALLAYDCDTAKEAEAWVEPIMNLRLRDMWIEKQPDGPPVLAVYTRNGGGNRECYCEGAGTCIGCHGEAATEHPAYLRDTDDEFDVTYRTYWFGFSPNLPTHLKEALTEAAEDPRDMSAMWHRAIDAITEEAR